MTFLTSAPFTTQARRAKSAGLALTYVHEHAASVGPGMSGSPGIARDSAESASSPFILSHAGAEGGKIYSQALPLGASPSIVITKSTDAASGKLKTLLVHVSSVRAVPAESILQSMLGGPPRRVVVAEDVKLTLDDSDGLSSQSSQCSDTSRRNRRDEAEKALEQARADLVAVDKRAALEGIQRGWDKHPDLRVAADRVAEAEGLLSQVTVAYTDDVAIPDDLKEDLMARFDLASDEVDALSREPRAFPARRPQGHPLRCCCRRPPRTPAPR